LIPDRIRGVFAHGKPDSSNDSKQQAYDIRDPTAIKPNGWRDQKCPVSDADEDDSRSDIEGIVRDAEFGIFLELS
jgi:hypothetical protein